jgi:hypothetical protein
MLAERVKQRLQLTAWPILPSLDPLDDASTKLASGIVDYQRAQLNPSVDWVKDASGWRPVQIKRWPKAVQFTDLSGNPLIFASQRLRRILKMPSSNGIAVYALYTDGPLPRKPALIQRWGPVSLSDTPIQIDLCGGGVLKLADLADLIMASVPSSGNTCG